MIWRPKPGMRVEIRYNPKARNVYNCHGKHGTITNICRGPGPLNVQVKLDCGGYAIVPRGNLFNLSPSPSRAAGGSAMRGEGRGEGDRWDEPGPPLTKKDIARAETIIREQIDDHYNLEKRVRREQTLPPVSLKQAKQLNEFFQQHNKLRAADR